MSEAVERDAAKRSRIFQHAIQQESDSLAIRATGVIAVLDFPVVSGSARGDLAVEVSEAVQARLALHRERVTLVERTQVAQLLKERNYQQASRGWTDDEAARFAQELHANAAAFGTIVSVGNTRVYINMRIVDVRTGKLLDARTTDVLSIP